MKNVILLTMLLVTSVFSYEAVGDEIKEVSGVAAFHESTEKITPLLPDYDPDYTDPVIVEQQRVENVQSLLDYVESDDQIKKDMGQKNYKDFIDAINEIAAISQTTQEPFAATSQSVSSMAEVPFNTVINSNTVWDEDVHLNGRVYVDSAMLVISPGVTVYNDPNSGIIVRNNGVLIAKGLADNPITFIADFPWATTEYDFAIAIEETAMPECIVNYCKISNASKGIHIQNIELSKPIENNTFNRCYDGIVQHGPDLTAVYNNIITNSTDDGIKISMADPSDPNTVSSFTEIKIEHNLINDASYGISIYGANSSDDAGLVIINNNCITSCSQDAIYQTGWISTIRVTNAFYANNQVSNPQLDTLPVYLEDDPFVNGVDMEPYYIIQDCNMVDAAFTYNSVTLLVNEEAVSYTNLIGKTTSENGFYDSGIADIGYHYQGWDDTTMDPNLFGDMTSDDFVNFADYCVLSDNWLLTYDPNDPLVPLDPNDPIISADINKDLSVDVSDLIILASQWLYTKGSPYTDINMTLSQSAGSVSGTLDVGATGYSNEVEQIFLLIDGEPYGKLNTRVINDTNIKVDTNSMPNGVHSFRLAVVDSEQNIELSQKTNVTFNNALHNVAASDYFDPDRDYGLYANYNGSNSLNINVLDIDGVSVWSSTDNGGVAKSVSSSTFSDNSFYDIEIEEDGGSNGWNKKTSKKFDINKVSEYIEVLISCPDEGVREGRMPAIQAVIDAAEAQGLEYVVLYRRNCTYDNVAYCLTDRPVRYWYHTGHGNQQVGLINPVYRTLIDLHDGITVSYKRSDYAPGQVPDTYGDLGWWNERYANSICAMGVPYGKLRIVQIDSCYSASVNNAVSYQSNELYYGDMAYFLRIGGSRQVYIGWQEAAFVYLADYTEFSRRIWYKLGTGSSLHYAIDHALSGPNSGGLLGPGYNYHIQGNGASLYDVLLN